MGRNDFFSPLLGDPGLRRRHVDWAFQFPTSKIALDTRIDYFSTLIFPRENLVVVVTAGTRTVAIPLLHVAETMRPLPIEPVANTPTFVLGMSVIRGAATPVVDLDALLGNAEPGKRHGRFVTLKLGERRAALAVDGVTGVVHLDAAHWGEAPPMLRDVSAALVEAIATRDAHLLVVLRVARLLPESVWAALSAAETGR